MSERFSSGWRWTGSVLAFVLISIACSRLNGCMAHRRPALLKAEEEILVQTAPLPYSVAVMPWPSGDAAHHGMSGEAYAETLAKTLDGSGAFRGSRLVRDASA